MEGYASAIRVYARTPAGQRACESADSGLPTHYRRLISLIQNRTLAEEICHAMQGYSAREVQSWLDELETLCFIELQVEKQRRHIHGTQNEAA
ncbi:MAG: hypothetical protein A3G81_25940 [Betaproteobacteria bacterium RIFCSPLOWO2_12_FULL_65_14]|nr:MAG: hypothetical protein A3G81_25940 [Betaproteobacteria bacterium RIFCSPLOWO2_12_FULL_65_14]